MKKNVIMSAVLLLFTMSAFSQGVFEKVYPIQIGNVEWDTKNVEAEKPNGRGKATGNNDCPFGWRLPSSSEIQQLLNASGGGMPGILDGVNGVWFSGKGRAAEGIFLPCTGGNDDFWGIYPKAKAGFYWTITQTTTPFFPPPPKNTIIGDFVHHDALKVDNSGGRIYKAFIRDRRENNIKPDGFFSRCVRDL